MWGTYICTVHNTVGVGYVCTVGVCDLRTYMKVAHFQSVNILAVQK